MTRYTPQWLQAGSYAASQDRRLITALWPSSASSGLAVSVASAMTLNVAPGQAAVPSPNNTGNTLCSSDAVEQVVLPAAPTSGTNRIDLVIVRPRSADWNTGNTEDFIFDSVQGAAVATPVAPATPAGTVALAQVYVGGGVASIVAGNITDVRPQGLSISGGGAVPPYTGAGIGSYVAPDGEVWVAKNGVYGGAWKKARDVLHMAAHRTAAGSVSTSAVFPMNVVDSDPYGLYNSTSGILTVPIPGLWRMDGTVALVPTAAGQWVQAFIQANGSTLTYGMSHSGLAIWTVGTAFLIRPCIAGDTLAVGAAASVAMGIQTPNSVTHLTCDYLGTG